MDTMIDQTISHYCIVEKLGDGGMGVVYYPRGSRLHRFVALKFLPDQVARDPQALSRFRREAEAASALNHPNICTVHDVGEEGRHAFIAMEFFDGMTLKHRIGRQPLPTDELLPIAIEITDALDTTHGEGIVPSRHQAGEHLCCQARTCQDSRVWIGQGNVQNQCQRGFSDTQHAAANYHVYLMPEFACGEALAVAQSQ